MCNVGGLLFDSLEKLRAFMNNNECAKDFLGSIVKVDGILKDDMTATDGTVVGVSATSMFFVMTGIGRFFRHYQGHGRQPNTALVVNPAAGAGDGFMEVRVKTRNHGGIAAGMPLLLNFGLEYDHDVVKRETPRS